MIAGHDPRDSTSVAEPVPPYVEQIDEPVRPLTIGVPKEYFGEGLDAEVEGAIRGGAQGLRRPRGDGQRSVAAAQPICGGDLLRGGHGRGVEQPGPVRRRPLRPPGGEVEPDTEKEFGRLAAMYSATRAEGFGPEVQRRIMLGTYALSSGYYDAYYLKALKVRRLIKNDFDKAFAECDVVMGPTAPTAAFKIGEKADDPLAMYLSDIYTISCNLAGIAGMSVPCGFTAAGLPIGLQIQAAPFAEAKLLRIARMYERATDWHTRRPKRS